MENVKMAEMTAPMAITVEGVKGLAYGGQTLGTDILEIIKNAYDATVKGMGTKIAIDINRFHEKWLVMISDYGCGMDVAKLLDAIKIGRPANYKETDRKNNSMFHMGMKEALLNATFPCERYKDVNMSKLPDNNEWCIISHPFSESPDDVYNIVRGSSLHEDENGNAAFSLETNVHATNIPEMVFYNTGKYGYPSTVVCFEVSPLYGTSLFSSAQVPNVRAALLNETNIFEKFKEQVAHLVRTELRPLLELANSLDSPVEPIEIWFHQYPTGKDVLLTVPVKPLWNTHRGEFTINMTQELKKKKYSLRGSDKDYIIRVSYEYGLLDEKIADREYGPAKYRTCYRVDSKHSGFDIENDLQVISHNEFSRIFSRVEHNAFNRLSGCVHIHGDYSKSCFPLLSDKSGIVEGDATWIILFECLGERLRQALGIVQCKTATGWLNERIKILEDYGATVKKDFLVWDSGSKIPYVLVDREVVTLCAAFDRNLRGDDIIRLVDDWQGCLAKSTPAVLPAEPQEYLVVISGKRNRKLENLLQHKLAHYAPIPHKNPYKYTLMYLEGGEKKVVVTEKGIY